MCVCGGDGYVCFCLVCACAYGVCVDLCVCVSVSVYFYFFYQQRIYELNRTLEGCPNPYTKINN